jgi:hypothetical protein
MRSYKPAADECEIQRSKGSIFFLVFLLTMAGGIPYTQAEGWEYERLRLRPKVDVLEHYSDNIFLSADEEEGEFYTEIVPQLAVDFALTPRNYITAEAIGYFYRYDTYDNFDESEYFGQLSWNLETAKGSLLRAGASTASESVQPYGPEDTYAEYDRDRLFAEGRLAIGSITEVGAGFEHRTREFEDEAEQIDDYKRQQADFDVVYGRSRAFPLLLQYRYINQDNEILDDVDRDWVSHSVFTGAYWRGTGRMSGAFRVGYTAADFKDEGIDDISGFGADVDMTYRYSEITSIRLMGERSVQPVTTSERERGNYYVLSSAGIRFIHRKWDRITTELGYRYNHRKFNISETQDRVDEEHVAGVTIRYDFRRWIGFSLGYQFEDNNSDDDASDYTENSGRIGIHLYI